MKNFHLPLPDQTYAKLRSEAERVQVPLTSLVRDVIDQWLKAQLKSKRHAEIAAYAVEFAGTPLDLDRDLESGEVPQDAGGHPRRAN